MDDLTNREAWQVTVCSALTERPHILPQTTLLLLGPLLIHFLENLPCKIYTT